MRDAIKREVCSSVEIVFVELPARYSDADITAIGKHLTAAIACIFSGTTRKAASFFLQERAAVLCCGVSIPHASFAVL